VCLLVVAFRLVPGTPLLIGANRDEFLNRPADPMTVLRPAGPRVLGGRDHKAGGTWLAVNEHGVFAGLTNQPLGDRRDPTRRSRGELPLALTTRTDARSGVAAFVAGHRPADYNGSWLLAGDRDALFFIDFTGLVDPTADPLAPGLYVLENRSLRHPSPKADHVADALSGWPDAEGDDAVATLRLVLADHATSGPDEPGGPRSSSNCVHLDGYGTRSSCIMRWDEDLARPPQMWVADGPPCAAPYVDVSPLWGPGGPRSR
jgi:uncharacterized protein with NRDE domain